MTTMKEHLISLEGKLLSVNDSKGDGTVIIIKVLQGSPINWETITCSQDCITVKIFERSADEKVSNIATLTYLASAVKKIMW